MPDATWRQRAAFEFPLEKQPASGARGMVVTNNPLGSLAGAEMLAIGGNAVDAAVASLFTLTVVEPMMVGIFGAGMSTLRLADGTHRYINNYATAPAAATPDMYQTVSDTWPDYQVVAGRENDIGPRAVGVPGTLKGWCEMLTMYGKLPLSDVLAPAIRYAERGFPATQYLSDIIKFVADDLARFPETAKTFLPAGQPLEPGDLVRQPEYAATLQLIASQGPDLLYRGELGRTAAAYLQAAGGLITMDDLQGYETRHTDVVRGTYRGHDVIGPAPPSAGGVHIVEMLNILEGFDIAAMGFGSTDALHLLAEILKIGFADRRQFTGDPDFVDVPVEWLTSRALAEERRSEIDLQRARTIDTGYRADSPHTTHLTTADADGNVVAATHTVHSPFGAKITVPGTGMILNNTMNIFDPHPGLANSIEPGKRMTSAMSPVIVERAGQPLFATGAVGGTRIFPSVFQAIVNKIDHQMTAQEAVAAPRIWTQGEELEFEPGIPSAIQDALIARGHRLKPLRIVGAGMGMIEFDPDGMLHGASCWRADGTPVAIGGGMARSGIRFSV